MRVLFEEIGSFSKLFPKALGALELSLQVGDFAFSPITDKILRSWQSQDFCDKELLFSLFCRRDLFFLPSRDLAGMPVRISEVGLSLLVHFLREYIIWTKEKDDSWYYFQAAILHDIEKKALKVQAVIGRKMLVHPIIEFRRSIYPHIYFFLHQPHVPKHIYKETKRRLQDMVYDLLLSKQVHLEDLRMPFWTVQSKSSQAKSAGAIDK